MTPDEQDLIRRRQKSRAIVMALLLGAFVILIFAVAIVKIREGMMCRPPPPRRAASCAPRCLR